MAGKLYGIGVGPGDPELMTIKALKTMKACDVIAIPGKNPSESVAYRIAEGAYPEINEKEQLLITTPMTKDLKVLNDAYKKGAEAIEKLLDEGKSVGLLTLGDPTIYSTYMYVHKRIKARGYETKVISGIPSFCAAAACLNISLTEWNEELHVIPAVHNIEQELNYPGTRVLMKSARKIGQVKEKLIRDQAEVCMVENCGMDTQRIFRSAQEIPEDAGYYSLIIAKETK